MAFVMSLSNEETELSESEREEDHDLSMVTAKRFNCDDLYMRCDIKLHGSLNVDYMNYIWMIICLVFNLSNCFFAFYLL
jgi:nucleoporin GLE1